ncbi:MAG: hypothetical protein ABSC77_07930 [Terracidiphilus sp.]
MKSESVCLTLKAAKRFTIWLMVLIALTSVAIAETYQAYSGPTLPRQNVAVLKLSHVWVATVDGTPASVCKDYHYAYAVRQRTRYFCKSHDQIDTIELLPGNHTITFNFGMIPANTWANVNSTDTVADISENISVEAGKKYKAQRWWNKTGQYNRTGQNSYNMGIDWGVSITEEH